MSTTSQEMAWQMPTSLARPEKNACLSSASRETNSYPINGVRVEFPFKPYTAQMQMMAKIIEALKKGQNALLESPTGSGKSLALLCATLAWRQYEKNRRAEAEKRDEERKKEIAMIIESEAEEYQHICPSEEVDRRKRLRTHAKVEIAYEDDSFLVKEDQSQGTKINTSLSDDYIVVPRIYVGSRTHQQISQLVHELGRNTNYRPKMTVLGSREKYCIHPDVSKSDAKNDDCAALLDHHSCSFHNNTLTLTGHPDIKPSGKYAIWDIEELVKLGNETNACPYYASRLLADTAEIILCPYNYIIDPDIRKVMNIDLTNSIVILDEAHNIEDVAREAGSCEMTEIDLKLLNIELYQVIEWGFFPEIHRVVKVFVESLISWMVNSNDVFDRENDRKLMKLWDGPQIKDVLGSNLGIDIEVLHSRILPCFQSVKEHTENTKKEKERARTNGEVVSQLDPSTAHRPENDPSTERRRPNYRRCVSTAGIRLLEAIFGVLKYIYDEKRNCVDDYRLVLMKRVDGRSHQRDEMSPWEYKMSFWCLNPGLIFGDLAANCHSVILTSGTLSPMNSFQSELGVKFPITLEANHVIKPSQVWVRTVPSGPSQTALLGVYSQASKKKYIDDVGEALYGIAHTVPFGILCFVSAYSKIDMMLERWADTGLYNRINEKKHIVREPQTGSKEAFLETLESFYTRIKEAQRGNGSGKDGAIFFAVYRGKVSEGIDFSNDYCRAVIALGIPYPSIYDLKVSEKRRYNDKKRHNGQEVLSGQSWYNIQAFRAINQALGRCIRHQKDWGAIILLEERFCAPERLNGLSKWIRPLCEVRYQPFGKSMQDLAEFIAHRQELDHADSISTFFIKDENSAGSSSQPATVKYEDSETVIDLERLALCIEGESFTLNSAMNTDIEEIIDLTESIDSSSFSDGEMISMIPEILDITESEYPAKEDKLCTTLSCKECRRHFLIGPNDSASLQPMTVSLRYCGEQNVLQIEKTGEWETTAGLPVRTWLVGGEGDVQDVKWHPLDELCYCPLLMACCKKVAGFYICASTSSSPSCPNAALVGKTWLYEALVDVQMGVRAEQIKAEYSTDEQQTSQLRRDDHFVYDIL